MRGGWRRRWGRRRNGVDRDDSKTTQNHAHNTCTNENPTFFVVPLRELHKMCLHAFFGFCFAQAKRADRSAVDREEKELVP